MSGMVEVLGLGHSLVDLLAYADDDFLSAQEMLKGAMNLIDEDRAEALYAARVDPRMISGGSAANTIVGVASFGVSPPISARSSRSAWRDFRRRYSRDRRRFSTAPAEHGPGTGRCFIYVTPDGERTMNTFLGASSYLSPDDVDEALVKSARFVYLEGYMWDRPAAKEAFRKAGEIARAATAGSPSRCRTRSASTGSAANSSSSCARGPSTRFSRTPTRSCRSTRRRISTRRSSVLRAEGVLAVVTRSEKGSVIVEGDQTGRRRRSRSPSSSTRRARATCSPPAFSPASRAGATWSPAGGSACLAAAEIIQHLGARPNVSLAGLAKKNGVAF